MKQKEENQPPPPSGERPGRRPIDYDESEAAREVRERMRRLREQRGEAPATTVRPPPGSTPTARPLSPRADEIPPILRELLGLPTPAPQPAPPPPIPVAVETQAALARQERMRTELRALETQQREAEATAAATRSRVPGASGSSQPGTRARRGGGGQPSGWPDDTDFLATLRDPRSARRAIILREILDQPVALR